MDRLVNVLSKKVLVAQMPRVTVSKRLGKLTFTQNTKVKKYKIYKLLKSIIPKMLIFELIKMEFTNFGVHK